MHSFYLWSMSPSHTLAEPASESRSFLSEDTELYAARPGGAGGIIMMAANRHGSAGGSLDSESDALE